MDGAPGGTRLFGGGHVAGGPCEEGGEVRLRVVAVGMLAEGEVAGDDCCADGRELVDGAGVVAEGLFAEELVNGVCGELGDVGAADVGPAVTAFEGATADEDGAGGAEGDELVHVDGHVGGGELIGLGFGVLHIVAIHPVGLSTRRCFRTARRSGGVPARRRPRRRS